MVRGCTVNCIYSNFILNGILLCLPIMVSGYNSNIHIIGFIQFRFKRQTIFIVGVTKMGLDSKEMIGVARERFEQLERKGFDWSSFYNGWLEGRADIMIKYDLVKKE